MAGGTIQKTAFGAASAISSFNALNAEWTAPQSGLVVYRLSANSSGGNAHINIADTSNSSLLVASLDVVQGSGTTTSFPAVAGHKYKITKFDNVHSVGVNLYPFL